MPPHNSSQLNQKQTLSFLIHHFESLKTLANKICTGKKQSNELLQNPELVKLQILQSVCLMQKKLCFNMENRNSLQFEDYITQFYQEELNKLRQQLIKAGNKVSKLEQITREMNQFSNQNDFNFNTQSPMSQLNLIQQRQLSIKLKKQLSHCQSLIEQNQIFVQEQNQVIKQLTQQIHTVQERQSQARVRHDEAVIKYDKKVKQNCDRFREMQKDFTQNRKIYQKQLKQLQITNSRLLQQKTSLEEQLLTKSQEITLLTTKIYDLQLTLTKYERQLSSKATQNVESNEAILMINQQMKIWKQKYYEVESNMKGKIMSVEEERKIVQESKRELMKEVDQLKRKITGYYQQNQLSSEKKIRQLQDLLNEKMRKIDQLQSQISELQSKNNTLTSTTKQLQKQISLLSSQSKDQLEQLIQLQSIIKDQKSLSQTIVQKNNQEKMKMKKEIYHEVQELLKINQETVKRVKVQQVKIKQQQHEIDDKNKKINAMQNMLKKVEIVNEEIIKRNQNVMKQLQSYKDVKTDLENKLQEKDKELQQAVKFKTQLRQQQKQLKSLQKQLTQKTQRAQQLFKQHQQLKKTIDTQQFEQSNQHSLTQQISLLKQQHCRKDFVIKQLQSKINLLQQELRETQQVTEVQRDNMKVKIKELEELVKERYDFSNRPSNCG